AARIASEDLTRQVARLETAGLGVGDQARFVEESLTQQRAALVAAAHGMRADHEALAAEAESQMAQLREILTHAQGGAGEISEVAVRSADQLRHLLAQAADQLHEMAQAAAEERDLLSAGAAQSLGAVSELAARERELLERQVHECVDLLIAAADAAARAAAEHAQTARDRVDQLGEAAFTAGQRADAIFESRLNEARGLIEQSAQLVEEAGAKANSRLAEGLAATQATLAQTETLVSALDERLQALPQEAQARADAVRESIERSMEDLMASARRAAEETQSIDAAFQDRVRRNYEMLSEAVRLMGVVAGSAGSGGTGRVAHHTPYAPSPQPAAAQPVVPRPEAPTRPPVAERPAEPAPPLQAPPAASSQGAPDAGLRPRLKLTPTASDEEFKTVFDASGGRAPPAEPQGDSWTWKELLSSMDDKPADEGVLSDNLLNEIEGMGIDAVALLPRLRIDEIATAIQVGDTNAARSIVRRLAPAAIRRLARRMMTDRGFRGQADHFAKRYQGLVADAGASGDGNVATALLSSDQGRAYLLIDAAAGETA
ncbi:MAG: polar localization protein TipN, partial [Caulobacteraceae bacterium]|nr:polar localization protein TipN [Caulobacteraceae bacterium]